MEGRLHSLATSFTHEGSQDFLRAIAYPNGVTLNLSPLGHITSPIEAARSYNSPGTATQSYIQNVYDNAYNRTQVTETDQFGNQSVATYAYDSNNQLINEHRGGTITYNTTYLYDSLGNRQQKIDSGAVTTNRYNAANQLLLSVPNTGQPTTSTYDGNGNLILENAGGTLTTYTWDYENRLASVATLAAGITTFVYSDDGHKQSTIIPTSTTNFLWDMDNILQEQSATGAVLAQYTQGPGTWGSLIGQRRGTTSQFYGADASQNVRLLFGATGSITDSWLYKAFGEVQNRTGSSVNYRQFGGNVNYWTENATLLRAGARIYEPTTGRWVSMDPIEFGGGLWNLYGYVGNNPVIWADPTGLDDCLKLGDMPKDIIKAIVKCIIDSGGDQEKLKDCLKDSLSDKACETAAEWFVCKYQYDGKDPCEDPEAKIYDTVCNECCSFQLSVCIICAKTLPGTGACNIPYWQCGKKCLCLESG